MDFGGREGGREGGRQAGRQHRLSCDRNALIVKFSISLSAFFNYWPLSRMSVSCCKHVPTKSPVPPSQLPARPCRAPLASMLALALTLAGVDMPGAKERPPPTPVPRGGPCGRLSHRVALSPGDK